MHGRALTSDAKNTSPLVTTSSTTKALSTIETLTTSRCATEDSMAENALPASTTWDGAAPIPHFEYLAQTVEVS